MEPEVFYGGYSHAARFLIERRGENFTRQGVYMWWTRRDHNGFPEMHVLLINGRERKFFNLEEVLAWYDSYSPSKGGRGTHRTEVPEGEKLIAQVPARSVAAYAIACPFQSRG